MNAVSTTHRAARPAYPVLACSFALAIAGVFATAPAFAQERVTAAENADALFTSPDPRLNANKQVAYHIVRDLLESNHWDLADQYLTERYIQHNPNAGSGRAGVVAYFTDVLHAKPSAIPDHLKTPVVSVVAEGDYVIVVYPREVPNATDPSKAYSTTWFDMWRIKDGKADEHWDPATRP